MELIDRVAFMKDLAERTEASKDLFKDDIQYLKVITVMNGFFQDLQEFPTVEAEPVVRCRDCEYHEDEEPGKVYCPNIVGGWVSKDFYCGSGKKKSEVEE